MTDTQLDPEMELEAQQLANYEDELRELAEEVSAQDEYFDEHKEEIIEGQKKVDEIIANEENNKQWVPLKKYSFQDFIPGKCYQSLNEDGEDDWFSITCNLMYWPMFWDFRITINEYSWWGRSLFVHMKKDWSSLDLTKHNLKDYQEAIDYLNSQAPFIYDLYEWNIQ